MLAQMHRQPAQPPAQVASPLRRPGLAYAHLNLRCNPFGELDGGQRAELALVELGGLAARLRRPGQAVQFLGERGRGKTTHLLALQRLLPEAPYRHLADGEPLPEIPAAAILLLDETQRMPLRMRRRVFRPPVSLALGSHTDHGPALRRAGYTVETRQVACHDATQLAAIFAARIAWARRGPGALPCVPARTVARLQALYGDALRDMEHHLYEALQRLEDVGDVEV